MDEKNVPPAITTTDDDPDRSQESVRLTQAELLFLLRMLGLPDLPGIGEKPWDNMTVDAAKQAFEDAGLNLNAQGLAFIDDQQHPAVVEPLGSVLKACAYPSEMVAVVFSQNKALPKQLYHYRVSDFDVQHTLPEYRVHEFRRAARLDMGLADLSNLVQGWNWDFVSPIVELPAAVFDSAQKAAQQDATVAARHLMDAGIDSQISEKLAMTLSSYQLKVMSQWVYQFSPKVNQMTISIIADQTVCWLAEHVTITNRPFVRIKAVNSRSLKQLVYSAFQPFDTSRIV